MFKKILIACILAITVVLAADNIIKVPKITKIAPILNDRIDTMKGTTWSSSLGPTFDKSANGYGWYQSYNKKVQVNHDPVTGHMVGTVYRQLAATGSGTIGGMTGEWAGTSFQGYAQTAYSSSPYQGGGTGNPGGRFPNASEFINGYLFGIFNDYDLYTGGEVSQAMFAVCDATLGWDFASWSTPKRIEAVNTGATPPAAWTGTGDVVYDPVGGYYYWTTFWSEGLANDSPYNLVTGRSLTPQNMNSWEWTDYNEYDFDATTSSGITEMLGKCVFSYAKDIYGNGTGFGIGIAAYVDETYQMTNSLGNPVDVSGHPRLGYVYTTNYGAEWIGAEFKPNWQTLGNQGNNLIPVDFYSLFDWFNSDVEGVKLNWPSITWNIDAVTTENNIVHVLAKVVGASTDNDYLYYVNNDKVIAGYYDIVGEITPTGVNWLSANYIAAFMGIDDGNTEWQYSNTHDHSIGYAGNGVVYASWIDRPETRYLVNSNPDPRKTYICDSYFSYSADNGTTWDIDKTVNFNGYDLYYVANVTKTSDLQDEGFCLATHGKVDGNTLTVFAACQYYDPANPLPPPNNDFYDYQQFLKVWKITGEINIPLSGQVSVIKPNGGEVISQGSQFEITWTDNFQENVKIDLYKNGLFFSEIVSSTESDGSYFWSVPSGITGEDYKIKISSVTDSLVYDISDGEFAIIPGKVWVRSPNGGELVDKSAPYEIKWLDALAEKVKIDLFKDDIFHSTIVSSTESDGSYLWDVESSLSGGGYKLKISSTILPNTHHDMSDNYFFISSSSIVLNKPESGNVLEMYSESLIEWADNISEDVVISIYKGESLITSFSEPSTGSCGWHFYTPVLTAGNDYRIRIESSVNSEMYDESGLFTIKGTNNVSGSLSGEWADSGSPYIITGPSYVGVSNSLTLNAGVKVKGAHGDDSFDVQGELLSQGIVSSPVIYQGIDLIFNNSANADSSKVFYSNFSQNEEYYTYEQTKKSGLSKTAYKTQTVRINNNSKVTIQNSRIENINNYGIIVNGAVPAICNNLIINNNGGVKFNNSSSSYIANNTIADNDSIGLYFDSNSDPMLLNNIVYGNGYYQVYLNDNGSDPDFYHNNIQGGSAGFGLSTGVVYAGSYAGNIAVNSLFESGSYILQATSPCVNTGYPDLTYEDLGYLYIPAKDLYGNGRLNGDIDMGCYEYHIPVAEPAVPSNVVITYEAGSVVLSWDESDNANSYLIYRSDDPYGIFTHAATVSLNTWSTLINTETKRFYYIVASADASKSDSIVPIFTRKLEKTKVPRIEDIIRKR